MLKFETKLKKCIRNRIKIYTIFILGGISSDIRSEKAFYTSAQTHVTVKTNFRLYISDDIPPK